MPLGPELLDCQPRDLALGEAFGTVASPPEVPESHPSLSTRQQRTHPFQPSQPHPIAFSWIRRMLSWEFVFLEHRPAAVFRFQEVGP
jgi:hypothetical protein